MTDLLVRGLSPDALQGLKERARRHGRSLQAEAKAILEAASAYTVTEAREVTAEWQRRLAGGTYTDSAEIIRAERER